jgi:hypothetical protein
MDSSHADLPHETHTPNQETARPNHQKDDEVSSTEVSPPAKKQTAKKTATKKGEVGEVSGENSSPEEN